MISRVSTEEYLKDCCALRREARCQYGSDGSDSNERTIIFYYLHLVLLVICDFTVSTVHTVFEASMCEAMQGSVE